MVFAPSVYGGEPGTRTPNRLRGDRLAGGVRRTFLRWIVALLERDHERVAGLMGRLQSVHVPVRVRAQRLVRTVRWLHLHAATCMAPVLWIEPRKSSRFKGGGQPDTDHDGGAGWS
jgi:hypothetical protein